MALTQIPLRSEVEEKDKWDLSDLFSGTEAWEKGLKELEGFIPQVGTFKGSLADSAQSLRDCLDLTIQKAERLEERLGYYAMLRKEEDVASSEATDRYNRLVAVSTRLAAESSYILPEIQAVPEDVMEGFLTEECLKEYNIYLRKLLKFRNHTLSEKEEALLAKQAEFAQTAQKAFSALTNADLDFGTIKTSDGEIPLTNSTYSVVLLDKDRSVREKGYKQFYKAFDQHKNTLSELYHGSVQKDIFNSRVRNYSSARQKALFPDDVPEEVYDNLIKTIHDHLPLLHEYYELRRSLLGVEKLRHYDVYVSLVQGNQKGYPYEESVDIISAALAPLGEEYVSTLKQGLLGRWVDRYENKGKRSGAFSAGSYTGEPYILMNYKEDDIGHLFTLAHEGGHSMHSWYSVRNNPFQHYGYTIFEAEVASTFNEELVAHWLLENKGDSTEFRAYLLGKQLDDIIGTIFRQTMFAEFELNAHRIIEEGKALTLEALRRVYRKLQAQYFGSAMELEEESDLECLRIPHFYRAFYVYKYATGLSAAIALSRRVLKGGEQERQDYLNFLKSGGSRYPLESLKVAGVDMSQPGPIVSAMEHFRELLGEFRNLMGN
jgi:oligoendopeptidase F